MKPTGSVVIGDIEISSDELEAFRTYRDYKILRDAMGLRPAGLGFAQCLKTK